MAIVTALQLIEKAFYLSQITSRQLQEVQGYQIQDGLYLLNALLDVKGSDLRLIPYYTQTIFNTIQGQEQYYIANQLSVETATFNIGVVRYEMQYLSRDRYFGVGRIDNVQSLPFSYHFERSFGGGNLYVYYVPQDVYVVKLWGKVGLTDVNLGTVLSSVYDTYYIEYLRFALAEYICIDYAQTFPPQAQKKLDEMRIKLLDVGVIDLTMKKVNTLGKKQIFNWAYANIPGWSPG
jgi:hypothetical protein